MHDKVLKQLGLLSILLMIIQGVLLGVIVLEKDYSQLEIILNEFLILFIAYLSYLWCYLKEKLIDENKWHAIIGGLVVILGRGLTCIGILYYVVNRYIKTGRREEVWFGVILSLLLAFAYIFMVINYNRTYERIVNLEIYVFLVAFGIVECIFGMGKWSILALAGVTIVGAVCRNQRNIDSFLERTQRNTPMITSLRKHNMKWILIAMLFLLLAYGLKDIMIAGLKVAWKGIAYVLIIILKFLFGTQEQENIPLDLGSADMGGAYLVEGAENGSNLYKIIICIILLVVCIIKRKEIWAFIKQKVHALVEYIKKVIAWLNKFLFHVEKHKDIANPYYSERVEEIKGIEPIKIRKHSKLSKWKFEKKIKELNKIEDKTLQYRKKYKLLMELLTWKGLAIKESDTPRQIHKEALEPPVSINLQVETKGYEDVRYGEKFVEQEAALSLDEHLKVLLDKGKNSKNI